MDTEKEFEMVEEIRNVVKAMTMASFEKAKESGEELTPVAVIAVEGEPSLKFMDEIGRMFRTMVFDKNGCVLIVIDVARLFRDAEGKDLCSVLIRGLAQKLNAFYAGLVSESWMAMYDKKKKWDGTPASKAPNRKEVVTIMDSTRHTSGCFMADISRLKGEDNHFREMGEWKDMLADKGVNEMQGRFTGFFGDVPGPAKA